MRITELWLVIVPVASVIFSGLAIRLLWRRGKSPWDA